ncbi:MAG: extracellular matrix regulator RemB [Ignavibacteriales bacterium]
MYIHLGSDEMLPIGDIIAIINIDPPISNSIKEIIDLAVAERTLYPICDRERAKSLVITTDKIYLSPISTITLFKRSRIEFGEV